MFRRLNISPAESIGPAARAPAGTATRTLSVGLGVAQLVAWATLYYPVAVLARPIADDLGLPRAMPFAAMTYVLIVAALVTPWVGRAVDARGGRTVLVAGSACGVAGLVTLALAGSWPLALVALAALGAAIALALYDAVFAALAWLGLGAFRSVSSGVALLGALASTASWPLVLALEGAIAWRGTLVVLAFALATITIPIYLALGPQLSRARREERAPSVASATPPTRAVALLACAFGLASFVTSALGVHLVELLGAHFTRERAVGVAALLGPAQIAGRLVERALQPRCSARASALAAIALLALSLALLLFAPSAAVLGLGACLYGAANGALTPARAAVTLEAFPGVALRGALLGRVAAASLFARAVAPLAFAAVATGLSSPSLAVASTLALAVLSLLAYAAAWRRGAAHSQEAASLRLPPCVGARRGFSASLGEVTRLSGRYETKPPEEERDMTESKSPESLAPRSSSPAAPVAADSSATTAEPCCEPTKQATCCAPSAKAACCGPEQTGKKGCC